MNNIVPVVEPFVTVVTESVAPAKKELHKAWWFGYIMAALGAGIDSSGLVYLFSDLHPFKYGYLISCVIGGILFVRGNPEKRLLYSGLSLIAVSAVMAKMNFDLLFQKTGEDYDFKIQMVNDYGWIVFTVTGVILILLWLRKEGKI